MLRQVNKAQAALGYVFLFMIVIAVFLTIGKYLRGAMAGKIRQAGDSIGGGRQYNPGDKSTYGHYGSGAKTQSSTNE
jgi:hypothetical protein